MFFWIPSFDEFFILGPGGAYPPAYPPPAGQAPGYNRQDSAVSTGSSTITQEHILMSMRSGVEDAVSISTVYPAWFYGLQSKLTRTEI